MQKLICFIMGHNWLCNQLPVGLGASRDCRRCGREEFVSWEVPGGAVGWELVDKRTRFKEYDRVRVEVKKCNKK